MIRNHFLFAVVALFATSALAADAPATRPAGDRGAVEKAFGETLTGCTLVGGFSVKGRDGPPKEDRYEIVKAVKAAGDEWTLTVKIGYKGLSLPVSLDVPVKWAGDTPVISVTDQKIPGFGTFTARVLFYGNQYAGTWDGADHGGQMWGRVERTAAATRPTAK